MKRIILGNIPIAGNIQKRSFINRVFSVFVKNAYVENLTNIDFIKIKVFLY